MHNIISWGKNTMACIYMMLLKFNTKVMLVQHNFLVISNPSRPGS